MVDPIPGLTKLVYNAAAPGKSASSSGTPQPASSASAGNGGDPVSVSPTAALDYFKNQAAQLKTELPGLVANSLLQPVSGNPVSLDPLNTLNDQFTSPLQSFLASPSANNLSKEQLQSLQQQVNGLKESIPQMQANALLAPLAQQSDSVNSLLENMSNRLNDLANLVLQKVQNK